MTGATPRRRRQQLDQINQGEQGYTVMPISIHGDAALPGVVAETLQLARGPHGTGPASSAEISAPRHVQDKQTPSAAAIWRMTTEMERP